MHWKFRVFKIPWDIIQFDVYATMIRKRMKIIKEVNVDYLIYISGIKFEKL